MIHAIRCFTKEAIVPHLVQWEMQEKLTNN